MSNKIMNTASKRQQQGATLVEALVAIIVFAIGMLGQVAFMLSAMHNNQQSRYRAIASYYAEEISAMAIADVANRAKYTVSKSACVDSNWVPCTTWLTRLKSDLPQISDTSTPINVTYDNSNTSATYGQMQVNIQWKASDGTSAQTLQSTTNLNLIEQ